jgi:hypothetical protein
MPNLMKLAAARGGPTSDNISLVAVTWENQELADETSSISTETMPLDVVTTQLNGPLSDRKGGGEDVSDVEIEKAIKEIQEAIKRYGKE